VRRPSLHERPWGAEEHGFAAAWRSQPKWVVSHTLKFEVVGPGLAGSLTNLGLIDEYRLYIHPVVIGSGKPFFTGPRPPLHLVASDRIGEDVIRLTYVPA
jgi:dihydrofolate reductase